jgi:hypothetical protein
MITATLTPPIPTQLFGMDIGTEVVLLPQGDIGYVFQEPITEFKDIEHLEASIPSKNSAEKDWFYQLDGSISSLDRWVGWVEGLIRNQIPDFPKFVPPDWTKETSVLPPEANKLRRWDRKVRGAIERMGFICQKFREMEKPSSI